jgi:hypothetical protein
MTTINFKVSQLEETFGIPRLDAQIICQLARANDEHGFIDTSKLSEQALGRVDTYTHKTGIGAIASLLPQAHGDDYIACRTDGCTEFNGLDYANMGDPYTTTIIHDKGEDEWLIGCWGNIVENDGERFGDDSYDDVEEDVVE